MVNVFWPLLPMTKLLFDPSSAAVELMTMPKKSISKGLMVRNGPELTVMPVRVMGCSGEYPVTPLVVRMLMDVVWTPGETEGALVLPPVSWKLVRLKLTGKVKVSPCFKGPVGRLEFFAWKTALPRIRPFSLVMGMLALQVTVMVDELPIATVPKLRGEVQFRGRATGEP